MDEHRKIYRVFQMISRLRSPLGCTKDEIAEDFDISVRTVERYYRLLQDLGFEIIKHRGRYKIEKIEPGQFKHEDMIVFTLEEAAAVKEALLSSQKLTGPIQKTLLDKLYALTDLDELSETLYRLTVSKNISNIRFAIKHQQQVVLKSYQSVSSSKVSDRMIEPIRFYDYYRYLSALEVSSGKIKQFKTERITGVELTGKPFKHKEKHKKLNIGIFGMSGNESVKVKLQLSRRASSLMIEEFPDSAPYIKTGKNIGYYNGHVYSFEGIGRFIMGLIDEVTIISPKELKGYVKNKILNAEIMKE